MFIRQALEALHQLGEEWIFNVGDDQAIDVTLTGAQGAGVGVWVISGAEDGRPDTFLRLCVHRRGPVHHA